MRIRPLLALASCVVVLASASPSQAASPAAKAEAPEDELRLERHVRIGTADIYRYRQVVDGLDVLGAGAIVRRRGGTDEVVNDSTLRTLRRTERARISRDDAIAAAEDAVGVLERRGPSTGSLAISPRSGGTLVWHVQVTAWRPLGDFDVLVDASSGDVLRLRDLLRRATGQASIFVPNPVDAQDAYANLRDRDDRNSGLLTALRTNVNLERIDDMQDCLVGQNVDARKGRHGDPVCRAGLDFTDVKRSQGTFEALMSYFHVDAIQEYIAGLGLGAINAESQRIDANAFRADNAFYSPFTDRIELGTGGVDDGEDGDIIWHEYGHAVQDAQVTDFGQSLQTGAMGEGFGDYLAAVGATEIGVGATAENAACVGEWDATAYANNNPKCLRRTDSLKGLDDLSSFCRSEVHCAGTVWASALWKLRGQLGDESGQSVMDRVVLASHELLASDASYDEGVQALLDADFDLYGGTHQAAITAEMTARDY